MKAARLVSAVLLMVFCLGLVVAPAIAEEKMSVKGKISGYDLDAKTLTIKTDDGKEMKFVIKNEKALQKLDDRLFKDDEVKIRYIIKDGQNIIEGVNDLRGTKPGC